MSWFFFALLSAFLNSLASLFERRTLYRLHSIDFSAALAFTTAILTFPVLFTSSWETITPGVFLFILLLSFVATIAFLYVTRGIRHMEISLSSPLFLLGPLITTLFAFMLLGERISSLQLTGMFVLVIGAYLLETKHLSSVVEFWENIWGNKYSRFIVLGLILYGLTSVGDRIVLGMWNVPVALYTAIIQLCIAIHFFLITIKFRGSPITSILLVQKYWKGIIFIALLTVGYRVTQGYATAMAAVGLVIAIKRSSSLFTTIIGGRLFHDQDVFRKAIACAIMIVGVVLIALK